MKILRIFRKDNPLITAYAELPHPGGSLFVRFRASVSLPLGAGDRRRKPLVDERCFRLTWAFRLRNNKKDRLKILRIFRKDNPLITAYAELPHRGGKPFGWSHTNFSAFPPWWGRWHFDQREK